MSPSLGAGIFANFHINTRILLTMVFDVVFGAPTYGPEPVDGEMKSLKPPEANHCMCPPRHGNTPNQANFLNPDAGLLLRNLIKLP